MKTEIQLTEALAFYLEKNVHTNAVEQIIDINAKKGYTVGMAWDEIESLNQARLAALKVQADYWSSMRQVWDITWGAAVTEMLGNASELDVEEYNNDRSLETVWEEGFYKQFGLADGVLVLKVYSDSEYLSLGFYFEDYENQGYIVSNSLVLPDSWEVEPEDDERVTGRELLSIQDQGTIDVAPLVQAAREVIEKLIVQAGVGQLTS